MVSRQVATTTAVKAPQMPPGRVPAPVPLPAELGGHIATLDAWRYGSSGDLVPAAVIPALRNELERRSQPATSRYQLAVLATMLAAFPQRAPEHVGEYLGALAEETADYSDQVLYETAREIRRTMRFLPTIAEFREVADRHARAAAVRLDKLERMERQRVAAGREERLRQLYGGRVSIEDANEAAARLERIRKAGAPITEDELRAWWKALFSDDGSQAALEVCELASHGMIMRADEPRLLELIKVLSGSGCARPPHRSEDERA